MFAVLKKHSVSITLGIIVLCAAFFRFYQLDSNPPSIYWDEASIGYNAYSVLKTGKDEFGTWFPILFRAFNEYKSPGYIYLTIIPVFLFGLHEFSVRFISAFLGTLTVLVSYFLVKELLHFLENEKSSLLKSLFSYRNVIAHLTAVLLAISPWHLQFSRAGFEANAGLFFIVLGIYLLLKNIKKTSGSFIGAMVCFALSFYFYRSFYIFTPLLLLGSILIFRNELKKQLKNRWFWLGIVIFLAIFIPFIPSMISKEGMARTQATSITNIVFEDLNQAAIMRQKLGDPLWARVLFDRRVVYVKRVVENYLIHFSPKFLFLEGDTNARHRTVNVAVMYMWEAIFLLVGLYLIFRFPPTLRNFILLWVLLVPIAASFAMPVPHALRTLHFLPIPQFLVALGIVYGLIRLRGLHQYIYIGLLIVVCIGFFIRYQYDYGYTTHVVSKEWGDGYKQLVSYTTQKENQYDKILISGHYWQPYIYFLFYKQYDPTSFQCFGNKEGFDKYLFGGTSWDGGAELGAADLKKMTKGSNTLVALSPKEYTMQKSNIRKLDEIYDHSNTLIFVLGELR